MTGSSAVDVLIGVAAAITAWQTVWKRAMLPVLKAAKRLNLIYDTFKPEGEYVHLLDALATVTTEVRGLATDLRTHMTEEGDQFVKLAAGLDEHRAEDALRFDTLDAAIREMGHISPPSVT